jgi:NTP pyrophosphatase (non-canonical NTP hydrolase)
MKSDNIEYISEQELYLQKQYGYRVDETPYNELKFNNTDMNINITEATTTFPCPVNKLKGQLMDNIGMSWETDHGGFTINKYSIEWIMRNIQTSRYNNQRCYVYNKAFSRYQDNHQQHDVLGGNLEDDHMVRSTLADAHARDQYNGKCRSGGLARDKRVECDDCTCKNPSQFDLIRFWAEDRGLYKGGDTKTQALKLVEEVGETCRAILKEDYEEITDGIGDCVVVLTNLAELHGVSIENCIEEAYNEIKNRKGKMVNGTYKKN